MNSLLAKKETTPAWQTLSHILPPRDADKDYWWQLTGRQLAHMVHEAGYPLAKQYETLLFHYHWTVPYFGPGPGPEGRPAAWSSLLGPLEGSPVEYSWKWNSSGNQVSHPSIRYSIEPIGKASGTMVDPLNQLPGRHMIHRLASQFPGVDLQWTEHFLASLFDHDKCKYAQEAEAGAQFTTTMMLAAEFNDDDTLFKSYFIPRKLGQDKGMLPLPQWKAPLQQLQPVNPARDMVYDFVENNPEGQKMIPMIISVDTVEPSKSRLKFYFQTARTSLASAQEIMTVGGRNPLSPTQLQELRSLICTVAGLPADYPDAKDVPRTHNYGASAEASVVEFPEFLTGYFYYFDMPPQSTRPPDVKLYIPTRHIGPDDLAVARSLVGWLKKRGRGAFGDNYMRMLERVAEHRRLDSGKGLQTYISVMFSHKTGEMDITSYIGAEAFDPARVPAAADIPIGRSKL